jgi:hypothetical protein
LNILQSLSFISETAILSIWKFLSL